MWAQVHQLRVLVAEVVLLSQLEQTRAIPAVGNLHVLKGPDGFNGCGYFYVR